MSLLLIPPYLYPAIRVALILVILVGMVILLLAINHLAHNDDTLNEKETRKFKDEVENEKDVISRRSVFHGFLARPKSKPTDK